METENRKIKHLARLRRAETLVYVSLIILGLDLVFYVSFVESTKVYPDWTRDVSMGVGIGGIVLLAYALVIIIYDWIFY